VERSLEGLWEELVCFLENFREKMKKDYKNLFSRFQSLEPPPGLFDRIILAIKREKESQEMKRLLFGFSLLLIVSSIVIPPSWMLLVKQIEDSGISYFISTAISDLSIFLTFWQEFSLAILESLPTVEIIIFSISLGISLFTLRLFLHIRKRLFFSI